MKLRRFSFALMELLIGMSLTALVMGMIFTSLYQTISLKAKLADAEALVMDRIYLQQRLDTLFANVESDDPPVKSPIILTKDNVLEISFNNGIDPNLKFCDRVKGKLYLNATQLVLEIEGDGESRIEILKNGVSALRYDFLTIEDDEVVETQKWDKAYTYPPLYLKMTLATNEAYAFWINYPHSGIPIKAGTKK